MIKIVVPSDSSPELYPDNTIGHYKARLSEPIMQLNQSSTIALNAITYPTSANFYVTLPGLVRATLSGSNVRSVAVEQGTIKDDGLYTKNMVTTSFKNLIFMPLTTGDIREIEVDIIDPSTGETVKFKDGKIVCTFLISRHNDDIY